jgi:hypothetical protein
MKTLQIQRKESEIDLLFEGKLLIRIKNSETSEQQLAEICARGWQLSAFEG